MLNFKLKKFFLFHGPAIISGILLVMCFPKPDFYLLAWVAMVPFLISLYNKEPKQSFVSGFFLGIPYFFGTLYWIYYSINHYGGISFSGSIFLVILLCLYLSLYTGLFAFIFSVAIQNTKLPGLIIAPIFWVVIEFIRAYAFTGFPWSSLGYSQYKFLSIIQIADITGIYGISFLIMSLNGAISDIILLKKRINNIPLFPKYQFYFWLISLVLVFILSIIYGQIRLSQDRAGKTITASIIQGNIEQDKKWDSSYQNEVLSAYKEITLAASLKKPDIIIWPETALPFFFGEDISLTRNIIDFQKNISTNLLFGTIMFKDKKKQPFQLSNSAVLLNETGKVIFTYDKIHMVPFGEYVPLRNILFFIDKLVTGIGDYTPGKSYIKAKSSSGNFAVLICYEIIFPGLVRKFFTDKGDYIVNITNDAWFGKTSGPYQHFSMAVFRAIENRKPVLRAANTGISGFIDSNGRILYKTNLFEKTFLVEKIKTDCTKSFYSKYGDLFSYFCIIFTVILLSNLSGKIRNYLKEV
ncbi:MAG: apolipoprotein N-acyltransferase [Nitrospirae bacterium]|nr:apolipoprotein N-acyltransferase [Nitrospirota bacterium]